ncbi:MAG: DnaJ domain-containing protein, partial [Nitrospinaceae bacterium]|nr:DnaJ domain-containing protein [Nitrospinaceae bacterium]
MSATTDKRQRAEYREALNTLGLKMSTERVYVKYAFRKLAFECHPDLHGGNEEKKRQFQELVKAYQTITEDLPLAPPPGPEKTSPTQGRDLHFRLRLAFLQAVLGGEVSMNYIRRAACPSCRGGRRRVCPKCSNMGLSDADAQIKVDVPRGIEDGEILRFRGSGNDGLEGGTAGDLYLLVSVDEHPALKRRGLDIYSEVKL